MTKYLLGAAAAAAVVAMSPALAQVPGQPVPQAQANPGQPAWQGRASVHTRAEVANHVRTMFARLDTNRDGYLVKAEADAARASFRQFAGQRRQQGAKLGGRQANSGAAFDRLDTNHDGAITRSEFDAVRAQRLARRDVNGDGRPDARRGRRMGGGMGMGLGGHMFEMADLNRDGRVTLQEATNAALRHFDMADVNRDGRITPDERMQMRQRMRTEHRG
jgi:Ca2+-binding EF-hand superfamily protein